MPITWNSFNETGERAFAPLACIGTIEAGFGAHTGLAKTSLSFPEEGNLWNWEPSNKLPLIVQAFIRAP
jgi:hypothetical protein